MFLAQAKALLNDGYNKEARGMVEADNKAAMAALENFKKRYPAVTSADLQTFLLGWEAASYEYN